MWNYLLCFGVYVIKYVYCMIEFVYYDVIFYFECI